MGAFDRVRSVTSAWGFYSNPSATFTGSAWYDTSGNNRHAVVYGGQPTLVDGVLQFVPGQGMQFPPGSIPNQFTIVVRAAMMPGANGRIFTGGATNWLLGWWNGVMQVAYFQDWTVYQVR